MPPIPRTRGGDFLDVKTTIKTFLEEKYDPNVADYFCEQIIKRAQEQNINIY